MRRRRKRRNNTGIVILFRKIDDRQSLSVSLLVKVTEIKIGSDLKHYNGVMVCFGNQLRHCQRYQPLVLSFISDEHADRVFAFIGRERNLECGFFERVFLADEFTNRAKHSVCVDILRNNLAAGFAAAGGCSKSVVRIDRPSCHLLNDTVRPAAPVPRCFISLSAIF